MPDKENPYPVDYAIWAFKIAAEIFRTMPRQEEEDPKTEKGTGRRAAIEAQKARKNAENE